MTTGFQEAFGIGNMYACNTTQANPTPVAFGVIKDVSLDFSFATKPLVGQYQTPVAIARGTQTIKGKATFARIYAQAFNSLFANQIITTGVTNEIYNNEAHSVPGTSTYTVTVTNVTSGIQDLGVFYANTGGQLTHVASLTAAGQYTYVASTGVYTFDSADASAALLFNYANTQASTGNTFTAPNMLMGDGPVFRLNLQNNYGGNILNFTLNQCMASKFSFPFKNEDWVKEDFEFEAMADVSGNVYSYSSTQ